MKEVESLNSPDQIHKGVIFATMAILDINISEVEFLPKPATHNFIDVEGRQVGFLTVLGYWGKNKQGHSQWLCLCQCGNYTAVEGTVLNKHRTISCGCWHRKTVSNTFRKHGKTKTPEYGCWQRMWSRCRNPRLRQWMDYGGRGIRVCDRWLKFENFLADMGERPSPNHSIDRIDNDGDYSPENCKWGTEEEQANNKRNNRLMTFQGKTQTMMQWCRELNVPQQRISARLKLGWDDVRALSEPVHNKGIRARKLPPSIL